MKDWWLLWCLGFIGNVLLYGCLTIFLLISSCSDKKHESTRYEYKPTTTTRTTHTTNYYNNTRTTNTNSYNNRNTNKKSNESDWDYRRYQYGSYDDYKENVPEDYREDIHIRIILKIGYIKIENQGDIRIENWLINYE